MLLYSIHRKYSYIPRLVKAFGVVEVDNLKFPKSESSGQYGGVPHSEVSPISAEIIEGVDMPSEEEPEPEADQKPSDGILALSSRIGLLLEYTEYGSLRDYLLANFKFPILESGIKFDQKLVKWVATETAECLVALCNAGIAHRDVKAANFLIFHEGDRLYLKITDLGMARVVGGPDDKKRTTSSIVNQEVFYPKHLNQYMFTLTTNSFQWAILIGMELPTLCCVDEEGQRPKLEHSWKHQFRCVDILREWAGVEKNAHKTYPKNVISVFKWIKRNKREGELVWHNDKWFDEPIPTAINMTYKFDFWRRAHMSEVLKVLKNQ
jgi:serine/threonine protein kinase